MAAITTTQLASSFLMKTVVWLSKFVCFSCNAMIYLLTNKPFPSTGTGSYTDPISFATATDNSNFGKCAIVYVPSLRKYFRNEDDCAECKSDWDGSQKYHIDLWTGSNTVDGKDALVACENSLPGGSNTIINNAPSGLPVDRKPFPLTCPVPSYFVSQQPVPPCPTCTFLLC